MVFTRKAVLVVAGLVACATAAGCAVGTPDPSQKALRYSGGPFSGIEFQGCVDPGQRSVTWPNDTFAYYSVGQQTWDFSTKPGAEAPPIKISTKDPTELAVEGAVTFTLDTSCAPYKEYRTDVNSGRSILVREWPGGLEQRFHETIGRHTNAFATEGGDPQPPGWAQDIGLYIGGPLAIAMNNASLKYTWADLYNRPDARIRWQDEVTAQLQLLVDEKTGARHFIIHQVQLGKPELPATLKAELDNNQAAQLRRTTAEIDKGTALGFPGGVVGLAEFQLRQAVAKAITEGKVRVVPVPEHAIVSVPGS